MRILDWCLFCVKSSLARGEQDIYRTDSRRYKLLSFLVPTLRKTHPNFQVSQTPYKRFTLYLHTFRERCEGDLTGKRTWYCSGGKHVHQSMVLQLLHVQEIRRWLFRIQVDGSRWLIAIKSWLGLYLWLIPVDFSVLVTLQPLIRVRYGQQTTIDLFHNLCFIKLVFSHNGPHPCSWTPSPSRARSSIFMSYKLVGRDLGTSSYLRQHLSLMQRQQSIRQLSYSQPYSSS